MQLQRIFTRHQALIAVVICAAFINACKSKPEGAPQTGASQTDSTMMAPASDLVKGQRAHEAGSVANADGVVPAKDSSGVMVVGWDELVRNGTKYEGQRVHMKTLVGGILPLKKKETVMGILFPVDMDLEMSAALMTFVHENPQDAHTLPVACIFSSSADSKNVFEGKVSTIEGTVRVMKTGPATGFAIKRGITDMSYVLLQDAHVAVKKH